MHHVVEDQLSEALDLPGNSQDLPPAITNISLPPQLIPQQMINPPHPGSPAHDINPPLSTGTTVHKTPLPPVPQRVLDKIRKGEYVNFGTLTIKGMYGASETQTSK